MNGDIGKLPSGAVYPTTPESLAVTAPTSDYSGSLNGVTDSLETYVQASTPPGGSLADPSPGSDAGIPLDQLKQMLSSQLEYYFSRENLANDAYLLSQMDNDQYVPIWTVANFNQVKKLTKDIKLITEVLRESPNVQVDEEGIKVRPNHKRCIVILREIPDNTPLDEVKALFSGEGCPRLISCEFAHNNSWYVTFESDEDAQKAYRFLREEVREFQGKPIMARIKAKPMNRLPLPPVSAMGAAAMKNGYRTPPTAIYDPNSYQSQQRFLYSNGSSLPPNVNYGNQVQIYPPSSCFQAFQHQQPFYPPGMLQPWAPAGPGFVELGSVFSFNGLAPQASFTKPQGSRTYNPRSRNKRNQPLGDRSSLSDVMNLSRHSTGSHSYHHHLGGMGSSVTGTVGGTHNKNPSSACGSNPSTGGKLQTVAAVGVVNDAHNHSKSHQSSVQDASDTSSVPSQNLPGPLLRGDSEDYRQPRDLLSTKEPMPPRHRRRRKEDEVVGTGRTSVIGSGKPSSGGSPQPAGRESIVSNSRGAQFDLEATAFPPLPGMDNGVGVNTKSAVPVETVPVDTSSSHWENRLSDVVKGTAKVKCQNASTNPKDKDLSSGVGTVSPRATTPTSPVPKSAVPPVPVENKQAQLQQVTQQQQQLLLQPHNQPQLQQPQQSLQQLHHNQLISNTNQHNQQQQQPLPRPHQPVLQQQQSILQQQPVQQQKLPMLQQQLPVMQQKLPLQQQQQPAQEQQLSVLQHKQVHQQQLPVHQQQPPMPLQQLPMHQQQPPVSQQQLPMHQQQPPVPQQQLPLHQQQSSVPQQLQQPSVPQQLPPSVQQQLPVNQHMQPPVQQQPSVHQQQQLSGHQQQQSVHQQPAQQLQQAAQEQQQPAQEQQQVQEQQQLVHKPPQQQQQHPAQQEPQQQSVQQHQALPPAAQLHQQQHHQQQLQQQQQLQHQQQHHFHHHHHHQHQHHHSPQLHKQQQNLQSQPQQIQPQAHPQISSQQSVQVPVALAQVVQKNQMQQPLLPSSVARQPSAMQSQQRQPSHSTFPLSVTTVQVSDKETKDVGTGNDTGLCSFAPTPPLSPEKTVPVATKLMADKATKTDETLLSNEFIGGSQSSSTKTGDGHIVKHSLPTPPNVVVPAFSKPVPTTTNAATMTSAVVVSDLMTAPSRMPAATAVTSTVTAASVVSHPAAKIYPGETFVNSMTVASASNVCSPHVAAFSGAAAIATTAVTTVAVSSSVESSGATARPSYAQVAQHHKEKVERMLREKQNSEQQEKEKREERERKRETAMTRVVQHGDLRDPIQREYKENPAARYLGMGRGRPGPAYERQDRSVGIRRREVSEKVPKFREMIRPRSPK